MESMQWDGNQSNLLDGPPYTAEAIITWINREGGSARYIPAGPLAQATNQKPLISISTSTGLQYATPGDTIVISKVWFEPHYGATYSLREFTIRKES